MQGQHTIPGDLSPALAGHGNNTCENGVGWAGWGYTQARDRGPVLEETADCGRYVPLVGGYVSLIDAVVTLVWPTMSCHAECFCFAEW